MPKTESVLRPLRADDIVSVVALWYRAWHHTFPELSHPDPQSAWEERFRADLAVRGVVWVAEMGGEIMGFIVVLKKDNSLDQIFVDPSRQHQGIGALLLEKAKELCPQGMSLWTLQRNVQAIRFYEKHGFIRGREGINKVNGQVNVEYLWQPRDQPGN